MSPVWLLLYRFATILGSILGVLGNALLLYTAYRTRRNMRSNAYLVITMASLDMVYSLDELLLQHEIFISNGRIVFYSNGVDVLLPESLRTAVVSFHLYLLFQSVYMIFAQSHYRYITITNPSASPKTLLRDVVVTAAFAWLTAFLAVRALENDWELTEYRIGGDIATPIGSVSDVKTPSAITFYLATVIFTTTSLLSAAYFAYRNFVEANLHSFKVSDRTRQLQKQFTRNLIANTCVAVCNVAMPLLIILLAVILRVSNPYTAMICYVPMTWQACTNAFFSLLLIKSYRNYIKKSLFARRDVSDIHMISACHVSSTCNSLATNHYATYNTTRTSKQQHFFDYRHQMTSFDM